MYKLNICDIIKGAKIEKNSQRKATDAKADMEEGVERYIRRYFIPNFDKEEFKKAVVKVVSKLNLPITYLAY